MFFYSINRLNSVIYDKRDVNFLLIMEKIRKYVTKVLIIVSNTDFNSFH